LKSKSQKEREKNMTKLELFKECCGVIQQAEPSMFKNANLVMRFLPIEGDEKNLKRSVIMVEAKDVLPTDRWMMRLTHSDLTKGLPSKKWNYLEEVCETITNAQ
jgi:cellobiose-specific phosphotransferase system component IIA